MTPGPDMALVTRNALRGGRRAEALAAYEVVLCGWLTLYGYLVVRTAWGRAGEGVRSTLNRVTGLVLIGLGVRLAAERS